MTVFAAQIATAKRLIAAKGVGITFERPDEINYDISTATSIGPSTISYSQPVAILPANGGGSEIDARAPGQIQAASNTRKLLMPAEGLTQTPQNGDRAKGIEGDDWTVISAVPLGPDNNPIIYTLIVKR